MSYFVVPLFLPPTLPPHPDVATLFFWFSSWEMTLTFSEDCVRFRRELLRRKFEQRPSRERLVTQHILLSGKRREEGADTAA